MTARPAPVVLDDLAEPRFSPAIDQLRAGLVDMAPMCPIEPDALYHAAIEQTGLSDFGDTAYRRRLDVLCGALRHEAGLSPSGIVSWYTQLVQLLKNRLLIQDLLTRHPEIRDIRIERPIIICGQPRTGTTHLHNLISADPALRSLPYWESLEPVLPDGEQPGPGEPDPRLARTAFGLDVLNAALPYFNRMHEMTVDHVHEEIQLLAIDVSTMFFEAQALMPSWRDYFKAEDQTPVYEYLRTVLQVLQWLRGGTRWVLKSPQHLEQFGPLVSTFPDATFVVTHRDPASVTVSLATMVAYTARMAIDHIDPVAIGRYWSARCEDLFRACAADRDLLPADNSIDVVFHEFMADDIAMVEKIYAVADQPFTTETRKAMERFMVDNPRGRHGTIVYRPEEFGIDRAERHAALDSYMRQFGVRREDRHA
ncbi:MAG: sulfotransferase [Acidimicrobiales bacterium]|nr:sulfotransferase [Acidimicrobiales bacterium]